MTISPESRHKPKVLLVGIDAADPDYLQSRFDKGELPYLKRIQAEGAWARMRSTFPVLSSAAWSTISTGLPPELHGVYEFFRRKPGSWQSEIVFGESKRGEDVWAIAARSGKRTVTINMPMTYRPRPVPDGLVVSGMDTPGEGSVFVSPAEEKAVLLNEVPDYIIELTAGQSRSIDAFVEDSKRMVQARKRAALSLFKRWQPDFAIVVFTATDRILHALWKYVDPRHPASKRPEAEKWRQKIDSIYDEIDLGLGELTEWAGEDCCVVVCSDHGGAALHGVFHLNRWLHQNGYLTLQGGGFLLSLMRIPQKWVKKFVPRSLKNWFNKLLPHLHEDVVEKHGLALVDPTRTRVYAAYQSPTMRLNIAGREPGGIVQPGTDRDHLMREIKEKLESLVDPHTGKQPIRRVWLKEEAFPRGSSSDSSPDLVIEWADELYKVETDFGNLRGPLFTNIENPHIPLGVEINGDHALYGIFGARGKQIESGVNLGDIDITCVAPILLTVAGISVPGNMVGTIPDKLFRSDLSTGSSRAGENQSSADRSAVSAEQVYSAEERELLEKRLKDLGYM